MFGMSTADIIGSISMGLTSLPLPQELPYNYTVFYGTRIGNDQTCQAQGFAHVFGIMTMFAYNGMLCVYNACVIYFRMKEPTIQKWVEPVFHILPLSIGLGVSIFALIHDLFHPTDWDSWCSIASIEPAYLETEESERYNWYTQNKHNNDKNVIVLTGILFGIIIISFVLVVYRVMQMEFSIQKSRYMFKRQSDLVTRTENVIEVHKNSKVVTAYVFAYMLSFSITLGIMLIRAVINEPRWLIFLSFTLIPLQGFFNLFIFSWHKVYNYRRVHRDVSVWDSLLILFKGTEEPILFSRISFVSIDREQHRLEYEYSDERGNQEVHCIHQQEDVREEGTPRNDFDSNKAIDQFSRDVSLQNPGIDNDSNDKSNDLSGFSPAIVHSNPEENFSVNDSMGRLSWMSRSQRHSYDADNRSRFSRSLLSIGLSSGMSLNSRSQYHSYGSGVDDSNSSVSDA